MRWEHSCLYFAVFVSSFFLHITESWGLEFIIKQRYFSHDWDLQGCAIPDSVCDLSVFETFEVNDVKLNICLDWLSSKCMISGDFETGTVVNAGCASPDLRAFSVASPYNILARVDEVEYLGMTIGGLNWNYTCAPSDWWLEPSNDPTTSCRELNQQQAYQIRPVSASGSVNNAEWVAYLEFDLTPLLDHFRPFALFETFYIANLAAGCEIQLVNVQGPAVAYMGTTLRYGRNTTLNNYVAKRPKGISSGGSSSRNFSPHKLVSLPLVPSLFLGSYLAFLR